MKRAILVAAAAAMALSGTMAQAQSRGHGHGRSDDDRERGHQSSRGHDGHQSRSHDRGHDRSHDRGHQSRRGDDHRSGGHGRWSRGQVYPHHHSHDYKISDYGRYGWSRPPHGHAYYRTDGGDVVLAAIATGLILSVIGNGFGGGYSQSGAYQQPYAYGPPQPRGYDAYGRPVY